MVRAIWHVRAEPVIYIYVYKKRGRGMKVTCEQISKNKNDENIQNVHTWFINFFIIILNQFLLALYPISIFISCWL